MPTHNSEQRPIPLIMTLLCLVSDPEKLLSIGISLERPWLVRLAIWRGAKAESYSLPLQTDLQRVFPPDSPFLELGRFSPLHHAAYIGCPETCALLVQKGADPCQANSMGLSPLHVAILTNDLPTATTLIAYGADVNQEDHDGNTALHHAAMSNDLPESLFRFLKLAGADIDKVDRSGYSPLYSALLYKNTPTAQILLDLGARHDLHTYKHKHTALHFAAADDCLAPITHQLVIKGARINAEDTDGVSPLMSAVQHNTIHNARLLLDGGANPDSPDHARKTPLMAAKSSQMVSLLLQHGATATKADAEGISSLMYHCKPRHEAMADMLIKAGADVNHAAANGTTALMIACRNYAQEIVDILVANHADIEAMDNEDKTAFDHLFSGIQEGIALSLRKNRANPSLRRPPAPSHPNDTLS